MSYHSLFQRAWKSLYKVKAKKSEDTIATQYLDIVEGAASAKDLHFKTAGARSNKSWRFLSSEGITFKIALGLTLMRPFENIMYTFFAWQQKQAHLSKDACNLPIVIMATMSASPAAAAMHTFCVMLSSSLEEINEQGSLDAYLATFIPISN